MIVIFIIFTVTKIQADVNIQDLSHLHLRLAETPDCRDSKQHLKTLLLALDFPG